MVLSATELPASLCICLELLRPRTASCVCLQQRCSAFLHTTAACLWCTAQEAVVSSGFPIWIVELSSLVFQHLTQHTFGKECRSQSQKSHLLGHEHYKEQSHGTARGKSSFCLYGTLARDTRGRNSSERKMGGAT